MSAMKSLSIAIVLGISSFVSAQEAKLEVAGLNFKLPAAWKSVPPSSNMRKAQLEITVAGQEKPLSAVFFQFGGDVQQNVDRWKTQFGGTVQTNTEEVEAGGKKITFFKGTGTYTDPFSGAGAQENFALIGALIPMDDAGPVIIKLAGPKDAALSLYDTLKKLATSPFTVVK